MSGKVAVHAYFEKYEFLHAHLYAEIRKKRILHAGTTPNGQKIDFGIIIQAISRESGPTAPQVPIKKHKKF